LNIVQRERNDDIIVVCLDSYGDYEIVLLDVVKVNDNIRERESSLEESPQSVHIFLQEKLSMVSSKIMM